MSEQQPEQTVIQQLRADDPRIGNAVELGILFGTVDASHHKMWVIDRMLRALAGDKYDQLIKEFRDGDNGPDTYDWDCGNAP